MNSEGRFWLPSIVAISAATVAILWFLFGKRGNRGIPTATVTTEDSVVASTSASASSSTADSGVYDVFLSFCGVDTRNGFTDFLYTYLVDASIHTFRDDNELSVGEQIRPELLKAIKESKILIPIFSQNYAYSEWCLLELAQMVECHKNGGQMICPIFYDVDRSDVQNQRGSYEKAFRQHMKKFDEETVQSWREALRMVGELKWLELKKETNGREGELAKITVKKVLQFLKKNYTHVHENLVGMDNHIEELKRRLKVGSNGLRIVGIHGMGGLGKTTIAKVIYNQLFEHFEGHCFLDNVRENSRPRNGIVELQNQLVCKILKREVLKFSDACEGINRIKNAVRGRKVLIVLDDVDNRFQVDKLMGDHSWFEAQSRIIITTRDTKVLDAVERACQSEGPLDVYESYRPDFMDYDCSLQLFCKHAFMRDSPMEGYEFLSEEVVKIAAGLPLFLEVLGSEFFVERDKDVWEEKLRKLRVIPEEKVLEKLKISYDPLRYEEKQIFLDVACLFIGENKTEPCYMWDACNFFSKEGISILVGRSLITVGDDDILRMHDQLRDLGRQIVREEGLNEPGKRSRLWDEDESIHILETRQGTSRVEALRLPYEGFDRCLDAQDFHDLPNLRYLITRCGHDLDGDFKHLLSNLRWLKWAYLGKFKPTNLNLKNIVILDLSESTITENWEGWSGLKMAKKLKSLNLSRCHHIRFVPHLSTFESLEILKLHWCLELRRLDGLEQLNSLRYLEAGYCTSLKTLPSLSNLTKLVSLYLEGCYNLIEIQGLEKLESLEYLNLKCRSLTGVPDLSDLNKLIVLTAYRSEILPDFSNFKKLERLGISSSDNLIEFQGLDRLESLERLSISNCKSIERLPDLPNFGMLKDIKLKFCDKLHEVEGLGVIESLESLQIKKCAKLREIPDLRSLKNLKKLKISYCKLIEALPDFSNLEKLTKLNVSGCVKLPDIHGLEELNSLKKLSIVGCEGLRNLPDLPNTTIKRFHDYSGSESTEPINSSDNESTDDS